ncbi:outer membrane lipoprotein chaperone LolA [Ostreibacterium oceani]|uniref:Outer-membrane lipoprotein carrier protein n=1 Tax=Ostreibacterium oceani TaxID=2654998 RepID=A0A6N7EWB8_9GAMM|nr:outer membrane lipoprotein chaperone LolA [Ostreibacterium oceani]MPV85397.1 outer membrane lipoprotein chaperone LolA [Ostreibacterium oceani]
MKKWLLFFLTGWFAPMTYAQTTLLDNFFNQLETFEANFEQIVKQDNVVVQQSSGTVALKKPTKFYWDYQQPEVMQLVSNGVDFYHYDVALAQVTVRPVDEVAANALSTLLSGEKSVDALFDTQAIGRPAMQSRFADFRGNADVYFLLIPKETDEAALTQSEVIIGLSAENTLNYFYAKDDFGENTFYFSQIKQNQLTNDSLFDFVAPDGVDVFGQ